MIDSVVELVLIAIVAVAIKLTQSQSARDKAISAPVDGRSASGRARQDGPAGAARAPAQILISGLASCAGLTRLATTNLWARARG